MPVIVENEAAYVLHRRPFKESSLIVDIFSIAHGRVSIVVKSALSSKKQLAARLQAFQPLLLSWSGRSELKTLRAVETPSIGFNFQGKTLFSAYYLNELVLNLLPVQDPQPTVFGFYAECLSGLNDNNALEANLRCFEYRLLHQLGLAPDLDRDIHGEQLTCDSNYRLSSSGGFARVGGPALPNSTLPIGVITGHSLLELSTLVYESDPTVTLSNQTKRELKVLMRTLIDANLNGRTLKSRDMMKQLAQSHSPSLS